MKIKKIIRRVAITSVSALSLIATSAISQVLNPVTLSTNFIPVSCTNPVPSTGWFVGGQKQCTLFATLNCVTNAAVPAGVGTASFTIDGSPDADPSTATYFSTTNILTITYNTTNPVSGYMVFDTSMFQSVRIGQMRNTGTNIVATNLNSNIKYFLK